MNAVEKDGFDEEVRMWVRERVLPDGQGLLTDHINSIHENERYLPHIELPDNLVAVPDIVEVVKVFSLFEIRIVLSTDVLSRRMPLSSSSAFPINSSVPLSKPSPLPASSTNVPAPSPRSKESKWTRQTSTPTRN